MKLPDIQNHAVLAPMAGVNDPAFRAICKRMGAGLTYTEMISSKGLQYGNKKTRDMLVSLPEEGRLAVQLFGHEPDVMADAAKWIAQQYSDKLALIDVNMGCPVRKIAGKGDGAALMDEPELAASIVRAMAEAVPCPITVKFRLHHDDELPLRHSGLDPESTERADKTRLPFQATCAFAALMQDAGASAICVHGRTAGQMYRGSANRDIISYVARAVDIPVMASGDVYTQDDIDDYLQRGAAAVMVARGARGNPWIFSGHTPTLQERVDVAREHTTRLAKLNPHKLATMRKHIAWYFHGTPHATGIRRCVNTCIELEDYLALFSKIEANA